MIFSSKEEYKEIADNYFQFNDDEAERKSNIYKNIDPFPSIVPSLLNSSDIFKYVEKTAMIHPFYPTKLKSVSYPVKILGELVYWNKKGKQIKKNIREGDEFKLKPNSIVFIQLEPKFRLPDYIALRFN